MPLRFAGALVALLVVTGCSMGSALPDPGAALTAANGPLPAAARAANTLAIGDGTCWSGNLLGSDPQVALELSRTFDVTYFEAAYAIKDRPTFRTLEGCSGDHAVEIYRLVPVAEVQPEVSDFTTLLRTAGTEYARFSAAVAAACMDPTSARAARVSGIRDASVQPALPAGYRLGWTPPTVEQWGRGQRVFACTFTQDDPGPLRYSELRTRSLPTMLRTCIASGPRLYVDCARRHDRERIAVLDVSGAVAGGSVPGRSALRTTGRGVYLDLGPDFYRPLDRACTAYLRTISTDRHLSGVAEVDADAWPDEGGSYTVDCEADTPVSTESHVRTGSVYNRG